VPPRTGRDLKKTPPTTVRFKPELHEFIKEQAAQHPDGQSGVINDAVSLYARHVREHGKKIFKTIEGG
jgi:hypothetical protein